MKTQEMLGRPKGSARSRKSMSTRLLSAYECKAKVVLLSLAHWAVLLAGVALGIALPSWGVEQAFRWAVLIPWEGASSRMYRAASNPAEGT